MLSVQISSTNWRVVIENTKKGLYPFVGVFRCSPFAEIIFACSFEISRASHAGRACEAREKNPYFTCFFTVSLSLFSFVQYLLFDCSRVLQYAKIRAVLQSTNWCARGCKGLTFLVSERPLLRPSRSMYLSKFVFRFQH